MTDGRNKTIQGSEELFRLIFQNAQIGIGIFNIDKQHHFSNRALHEMLGYSEQELSDLYRRVRRKRPMLGPFSTATYSAITFPLEEGDRIVLVTDGIIEAKDASNEEFGMERLRQVVQSNHALPVGSFRDTVIGEIARWCGQGFGASRSDDITLLAIDFRRPPLGHRTQD